MNETEKKLFEKLSKLLGPEAAEAEFKRIDEETAKRKKEKQFLASFEEALLNPKPKKIIEEKESEALHNALIESCDEFIEPIILEEKPAAIPLGAQPLPQLPEKDFVTKAVKSLSKLSRNEYNDKVNETPESIRKEIDLMKKTITDLHRFARNASGMGGGGEVNLRYLDDINKSTFVNNYFLSYSSTSNNFLFANVTTAVDWLHIPSSIIPDVSLAHSLGNNTNRWESLWIGSNSITFSDTLGGPDQVLSLANQVFYITQGSGSNSTFNANAGFNAGGVILQNYTIGLANAQHDFTIGSPGDGGCILINRSLYVGNTSANLYEFSTNTTSTLISTPTTISNTLTIYGNTLANNITLEANAGITFSDNTTQSTAYKAPNVRIDAAISNSVLIDFASDNIIHVHTNAGTLTANIQNLSSGAGRSIELFIFNNIGGTQQFNHSLRSGTQATGGQSFYLSSHNLMYVKYFCLDGTANNTFVTAIV